MSTIDILKGNTNVQALVQQIYIGEAEEGISAPYVVLDYVTIIPENHLTELPTIEQQRIGIECYAVNQPDSIAIYEACRLALENTGQIQFVPIYGEQDEKTKLYLTLFDYSVWETR